VGRRHRQQPHQRLRLIRPLGRCSTPEEAAVLVGYLTTDMAAFVTSQTLNVCGGLGSF